MTAPKYPEIKVKLTGINGNAFNVVGVCQTAARKGGVSREDIAAFVAEAMSGDYENLLRVCSLWFKVR